MKRFFVDKKPSRFWTYKREEWLPDHRWLPYFGGDEWHRRTVVVAIPFGGYLVVALWHWRNCAECKDGWEPGEYARIPDA